MRGTPRAILGAVLAVVAASGAALRGALLPAVYAAGTVAPFFLMALFWDRLEGCRWLRGEENSVSDFSLRMTNPISGAVSVVLGVLYIACEGTHALFGLHESSGAADLIFAAERWANVTRGIPTTAILAALAVLLLWGQLRCGRAKEGAEVSKDGVYTAKRGGSA